MADFAAAEFAVASVRRRSLHCSLSRVPFSAAASLTALSRQPHGSRRRTLRHRFGSLVQTFVLGRSGERLRLSPGVTCRDSAAVACVKFSRPILGLSLTALSRQVPRTPFLVFWRRRKARLDSGLRRVPRLACNPPLRPRERFCTLPHILTVTTNSCFLDVNCNSRVARPAAKRLRTPTVTA